jgi:hypothetical protein
MKEPDYISKSTSAIPTLDYHRLRAEAIQYAQELTGAFWTDYNEHDPGVTILEQLCYALTDLAYRTEFPIQDHLAGNLGKQSASFRLPTQVFPCHSLTEADFRKILYDALPEVKNGWLFAVPPTENSIKGLYKIYVEIAEEAQSPEKITEITQDIRALFVANRNLGEDLEEIVVLEALPISVFADIEIDRTDELEGILAEVYFQLNRYFSPDVQFHSLAEMLARGYGLHDILAGPLLKHGFLKDEDLPVKSELLVVSEIIKILMQVKGVMSVKNLSLKVNDEVYENQLKLNINQYPKLIFGSKVGRDDFSIGFYKGALSYPNLDKVLFQRKLNELQSTHKRVYRLSEMHLDIPQGYPMNTQAYYSIQNQFPEIYGVGDTGIPDRADKARQAQARQLKGFLLLFEQILANYLAQLGNVRQLFSLESTTEPTYFYQTLHNVPHIQGLLRDTPDQLIETVGADKKLIPADYVSGLAALSKQHQVHLDRRNRMLDFLLALHGEDYIRYPLSLKNYYLEPVAFEHTVWQSKSQFLQNLSQLNHDRAKGLDYLAEITNAQHSTGTENRLRILLGLPEVREGTLPTSILDIFARKNLTITDTQADTQAIQTWGEAGKLENFGLTSAQIEAHFDWIDAADLPVFAENFDFQETLLAQTILYRCNAITPDFLRYGIDLNNYRLGNTPEKPDTYYLVFRHPETEAWLYIADYTFYEAGLLVTYTLIEFLRALSQQSEGLYCLEHILLRPDMQSEKFGFYALDEEGIPVLKSTRRYAFAQRLETVKQLENHLKIYENYTVEQRTDGDFEVQFQSKGGEINLISLQASESVQETHEKMERWYSYLGDKETITSFQHKTAMFLQSTEDGVIIPEDFFGFKASILLPNWTARCQDTEFRLLTEELVRENMPAYIAPTIFWLSIAQMKQFEQYYTEWLTEKRQNVTLESPAQQALLKFLLGLYD